jgi:hypothetical protein
MKLGKSGIRGIVMLKFVMPMLATCWLALLFAGCATTSSRAGAEMSKEEILNHEDVKGKTPTVFQQPLDKVREATLRALSFVGCEIKKQQTYYIEGHRPEKMGLFVGSGGETVQVFLYPQADNETHVWVDTDMSFLGIAGQRDWNDKVIAELYRILGSQASTP